EGRIDEEVWVPVDRPFAPPHLERLAQGLCFIEEGGEALAPSRCTDQKRHRHHNHSGDQEVTLQERSRPPRRGGRRSIRLGRTACAGCLRDSELRHARTLP